MQSKPPFHEQETRYSCVAACLRMVFAGFGLDIPESQLRAACDSTIIGTDALQAIDFARQSGFTRSAKHTLKLDELREVLAAGTFPIVFVSLLPIDAKPDTHAVVVIEISDQAVIVLDPLRGERAISPPIFNAAWTMARNLAILIER